MSKEINLFIFEQNFARNVLSKTLYMKRCSFALMVGLFLCNTLLAQINLIGLNASSVSGVVEVVKWNATDSTSVRSFPTNLLGWATNTALFNPNNGNYYVYGISNAVNGVFNFNTQTNQSNLNTLAPVNAFSNSSEIDMSTGIIYNVTADINGSLIITAYDASAGVTTTLGNIDDNEPNPLDNRCDASGFDSNNGILYYAGHDGTSQCLYKIPVRNASFSWSKVALPALADGNSYSSLNYDNTNNKLYAVTQALDANGNYSKASVLEIKTTDGETTNRGILPLNLLPGSSSNVSAFDQQSGSLLLIGYNNDNPLNTERNLFIFNTNNNTYQMGQTPQGSFLSEIVCDNYNYAALKYGGNTPPTVIVSEVNNNKVYPNPANQKFNLYIPGFTANTTYQVTNVSGQKLLTGIIKNANTEIYTPQLAKGLYFILIQQQGKTQTLRLVID